MSRSVLNKYLNLRIAGTLAIAVSLVSCPVHPNNGIGSLSLVVEDAEAGAKTIAPPVDMVSSSYDIYLTGPGDPVSVTGHTGTSIQFPALEAGLWTIEVLARNGAGTAILEGSADVTVDPSSNASATVTLAPVAGPGSLEISVSWPAGMVSSPAVTGTIGRMGGTMTPISLAVSGDGHSATNAISSIDSGYHVLNLEIRGGATALCRIMESVRIVSGAATTASFALKASDINGIPPAPSSLTVSMVSTASLNVGWQDNSYNETGFRVQRSLDGSMWSDIATLPFDTRSFADASLEPNTRYYYRVIAFNGFGESASTAAYESTDMLTAPTPSISPSPGTYSSAQSVSMACSVADAVIRYTTNGSMPSATNGIVYSTPFTVNSSVTLRAVAIRYGYHDSPVATAAIVISNSVSTPVFSPAPGVYHASTSVTLSSATAGAAINYTMDGSDPGEYVGTIYSGAFALPDDKETTIKAIAKLSGSTISDISSATYRKIAQPVFSPSPGTYTPTTGAIDVTITVPTSRSHVIRYTVDGTDPSVTNGFTYSGPFSIDRNRQVKAIALYEASWGVSLVASGYYYVQCVAPTFALPSGYFGSGLTVQISSQTPDSIVIYTTNGTTPTPTNGTYYTGPFILNSSATVYAVATKPNCLTSSSTSRTYTAGYGTQSPANGSETSRLPYFNWSDLIQVQSYRIQANTAADFSGTMSIDATGLASSSFQASTPLTLGATYYWRVAALDGTGWTAWSTPISFTVADIFARTYGGTSSDYGRSGRLTSDGGAIRAGYTSSFGAGSSDFWLIKTNPDDIVSWQKAFGGSGSDYAYSILETPDGGYIVAGSTTSFSAPSTDAWIVKLSSTGQIQWERRYGGPGTDVPNAIIQTTDGGYAVAGYTTPSGSSGKNAWIFKIDSSGSILWQNALAGVSDDVFNSITSTADGGILAAGSTKSAGAGNDDILIVKLEGSGAVSWQKTYGGSDADTAASVRPTIDGGYIVSGSSKSFSSYYSYSFLMKISGEGAIEFQKSYSIAYTGSILDVEQTTDGGYILGGSDDDDALIIKTDSTGNVSWQKVFRVSNYSYIYSILQNPAGGYSALGFTTAYGAGGYDFWSLKIKENGACGSLGTTYAMTITNTSCTVGNSTLTSQATSATETATSCTVTTTNCTVTTQI